MSTTAVELSALAKELLDKWRVAEEGIIHLRGTPRTELPELAAEVLQYEERIALATNATTPGQRVALAMATALQPSDIDTLRRFVDNEVKNVLNLICIAIAQHAGSEIAERIMSCVDDRLSI